MRFIVTASSEVGHGRDRTQMASGNSVITLSPEQIDQIKSLVAGICLHLPGEVVTVSVTLCNDNGIDICGKIHSTEMEVWKAALV